MANSPYADLHFRCADLNRFPSALLKLYQSFVSPLNVCRRVITWQDLSSPFSPLSALLCSLTAAPAKTNPIDLTWSLAIAYKHSSYPAAPRKAFIELTSTPANLLAPYAARKRRP